MDVCIYQSHSFIEETLFYKIISEKIRLCNFKCTLETYSVVFIIHDALYYLAKF